MLKDVVIAGGVRTPIGRFMGVLAQVPATRLGSVAARSSLERAAIAADQVDEVIFGNVLSAGQGQNIARQVSLGAGLPASVGATSINKVCGSGLKAVMLAAQAIQCGDAELVLAGGTENMSAAPYLLPKGRTGYRMGHGEIIDSMVKDGLWDVCNDVHMGTCGDRCAMRYGLSRKDQDDFAVTSYKRSIRAQRDGLFRDEIIPIETAGRKGLKIVDQDEEPGRFNEEKLRALEPAFDPKGTVTAGNASSISDGAACMAVLSAEKALRLGVRPQAKILGYASASREPEWFTLAPIDAIGQLLTQLKMSTQDVGLFEINEAFASVALSAMRDLQIPHDKLNVRGGAIALGHPIGASGARVLVTLLHAMQHEGAAVGVAALCIGGGEAVAIAVERM